MVKMHFPVKIALGQINVSCNDPESNVQKMISFAKEAFENKGTKIIAFPEMAVGGYLLGDKWTDENYCRDLMNYDEKLASLSLDYPDKVIIWGNVHVDSDKKKRNTDGRIRKYNAICIAENGKISKRFKTLLPNYRVFDDMRYFYSCGKDGIIPYETSWGMKIGVEACEDLWVDDSYDINPSIELIKQGVQCIINISASPFSIDKGKARDKRIEWLFHRANQREIIRKDNQNSFGEIPKLNFVPFFYVNCVGVQNNGKNIITFDGDSRIYNEKAKKQPFALDPYREGLLYGVIDGHIPYLHFAGAYESDFNTPVSPSSEKVVIIDYDNDIESTNAIDNLSPIEQKFLAIKEAYKYTHNMIGNMPFVIGLSGGVDSALSTVMAVIACGKESVRGLNLPSSYNTDKSKNIAGDLAKKLEIQYSEISIQEYRELFAKNMFLYGIHEENLQARLRGLILQTYASLHNGAVVCNANKVEIACGYTTYCGDDIGIFCPLGDLTKVEIFEMCRFINKKYRGIWGDNIIPLELLPDEDMNFSCPPSAELSNNQVDPFLWGLDDKIISLYRDYNENDMEFILYSWFLIDNYPDMLGVSKNILEKYGFDKVNTESFIKFTQHLEWLFDLMQKSVFKRIQAPPIVLTSKSSYGYDYRESLLPVLLTKGYKKVKFKIDLRLKS
jgi:NAD+ synthase (glutamine-hydrolysing)